MAGTTHRNGKDYAREILDSGKALEKLREIIEAQEGDPNVTSEDVEIGKFNEEILSRFEGYVTHLHNKKIFVLARAAGSPKDKGAGLILNKKRGDKVDKGEVLLTLYADNEAKLKRAKSLANKINALTIEGMVLEHIPGRPGIVDFSDKEK
jgi:AMP phosphorylase